MTILIGITDPNSRNAFAVGSALVLIGRACNWRAILLVFTQRAIDVLVASLIRVDATVRECAIAAAFELGTETRVGFAFDLIRAIATIRFAVA